MHCRRRCQLRVVLEKMGARHVLALVPDSLTNIDLYTGMAVAPQMSVLFKLAQVLFYLRGMGIPYR
jgi:hypothetical protein